MTRIFLTGGLGYIGSHTAISLADAGFEVVIFDNLSNSKREVLDQLETITGICFPFIEGDLRDTALLEDTLKAHQIDAVIHFAGLKAVGESIHSPLSYYENNVGGTVSLLRAMLTVNITSLTFSSSATVYGYPKYVPIDEKHPRSATNPYGQTKLLIEDILRDLARSDPRWRIVCLRYFNPIGGHKSGLIGDNPTGIPNNLMPYIARVAGGSFPYLQVFGDDYQTHDGTGVRDYIHVMDLAEGHRAALNFLETEAGWHAFNLGTGEGYSVLEMVRAFESASGQRIPYKISPRRPGDVAMCYADTQKAESALNWRVKQDLEAMCASAWLFQQRSINCDVN